MRQLGIFFAYAQSLFSSHSLKQLQHCNKHIKQQKEAINAFEMA